jgi:hypothetical protein
MTPIPLPTSKRFPLQWPTPEFYQHEPRDSAGATASVTLEITLRHLAIEQFLCSAIPSAARHIEQLSNGPILCVGPFNRHGCRKLSGMFLD